MKHVTRYPGVALIGQRAMGITRSSDPRPVLATQHLNMCVALHGYDKASGVGFLCHFDFEFAVAGLHKLAPKLASFAGSSARFDCTITGGRYWTWAFSACIRKRIREEVRFLNSQGFVQLNIVHETPMPKRWSRASLIHKPFAYCLDTRTGEAKPFVDGNPGLPLSQLLKRARFDYLPDPANREK